MDQVQIGKNFVTEETNASIGSKVIINFPTKMDWRNSSEYQYIEDGLIDLVKVIKANKIKSIAVPPLGAGNGGLNWEKVKTLIDKHLKSLEIEVLVYEPSTLIKERLKKERVKLTDARALLLYVLYDLVRNGEFVSEFSSEKLAYFLQKFGAAKYFKLTFQPKFYWPYSGKVRYLLNALNGSYLMGYSDMNKKPFEPLTLVADGYEEVKRYIEGKEELHEIARNTTQFLNGFYSDFALELLSSIDFISTKEKTLDSQVIIESLATWSERKSSMILNSKYLDVSLRHLASLKVSVVH